MRKLQSGLESDSGLLGCCFSVLVSPLNCLVQAHLPSLCPTDLPILVSSLVSLAIMHARGILAKVDPVQISTPEIHWRLFGKHPSMAE